MTARAAPLFTAYSSNNSTPLAAFVTLTVTKAVVYTDVRCVASRIRDHRHVTCNAWLFALPGETRFTMTPVASPSDRTGEGIACKCHRCNTLYEVVR